MSEPNSEPTAGNPPAPRAPGVRYVLFVLLGLAVVAFVFDLAARWKASAAHRVVDDMLREEDEGSQDLSASAARTPAEIRKQIGQDPELGEDVGNEFHETYSWRGVFNTYRVYVVYAGGTVSVDEPVEPLLMKVSLNQPPER